MNRTPNNRFERDAPPKSRLRAPQAKRYRAEQSSAYLAGWKSPSGKG